MEEKGDFPLSIAFPTGQKGGFPFLRAMGFALVEHGADPVAFDKRGGILPCRFLSERVFPSAALYTMSICYTVFLEHL